MLGQASAVPPNPHASSVKEKQKCVLFLLQGSLPAVPGLGQEGSNGRAAGKREVGVGTRRLTVWTYVPVSPLSQQRFPFSLSL